MGLKTSFGMALLLTVAGAFVSVTLPAAAAEDTVRKEMVGPLSDAQKLMKEGKFSETLAKLREADAVPGKTTYEQLLINQMRLFAALRSGDAAVASKTFETLTESGAVSGEEKLRDMLSIAQIYMRSSEFSSCATWAQRYLAAGGTDSAARTMVEQSYYSAKDYANAAKSAMENISSRERAGEVPTETTLQILADSAQKLSDAKTAVIASEKLVEYYPKAQYWDDLIHRVITKPGFARERLQLDIDRLTFAVGTFTDPNLYMDYAELAIQVGVPGEARTVVEKGFAAGVLGNGNESGRHIRLRNMTKNTVDNDIKSLSSDNGEAARAPTGDPLFAKGMDYFGYGQFDKALPLMEQGIAKGGLKNPDDAKLHLGIAYLQAGQKAKAVEALKSIKGTDGTADLARLWLIKAGTRPS